MPKHLAFFKTSFKTSFKNMSMFLKHLLKQIGPPAKSPGRCSTRNAAASRAFSPTAARWGYPGAFCVRTGRPSRDVSRYRDRPVVTLHIRVKIWLWPVVQECTRGLPAGALATAVRTVWQTYKRQGAQRRENGATYFLFPLNRPSKRREPEVHRLYTR